MADYAIPKAGAAYIFYGCLVSQADTKLFKSAPTLAAGDFKVSTDGAAFANLGTLPSNTPGTFSIKFTMSASEMTGDNILVVASDAAGAEWCDQCWNIQTAPRGVADLAYPATSGRSSAIDASGRALADVDTIKTNPVVNGGTITFPTTATLASTTNITAGTVTTATNLTNAPTAGDFTATMKTSLNAATPAVTVSDKTGFSLSAAGITAIWAEVITGTTTAVQAMRGFIAAMLGKASGLPTAPVYRNIADSKDVISATTDTDGNRTAVTLDLT